MTSASNQALVLLFTVILFSVLVSGCSGDDSYTTVTLNITAVSSSLIVIVDDAVKNIGYTVNGEVNATSVPISLEGETIEIIPHSLPSGTLLNSTFQYLGITKSSVGTFFKEDFPKYPIPISIYVYLSLETVPSPPGSGGGSGSGTIPSVPDTPSVPDVPENPDTPFFPENPDTPGSDTPGSDDYYRPILPPAGFVYNIAGFIPLAAGFLLLFLLFAFRGNLVYRLLRKQAKKNGYKPEKETLKATAAGVVALIRNEELYPEWRKNSETTARLTADISRVLDETHYPPEIPRGIVVARIIKAAKGRINRHRL